MPGYAPEEGEEEYKFFEDPWLALVKTGTMFIGEIEFSDIPIGNILLYFTAFLQTLPTHDSRNRGTFSYFTSLGKIE